jgi:hypothetical protein
VSRRGTPWLGPHARGRRAAVGASRGGGTRHQQHSQETGVEQRTCAWCLDSTSAPNTKHVAPGCWRPQRSTTLGRGVLAQRGRDPCLYRAVFTAPPLIRVCYYRCVLLFLLLLIANTARKPFDTGRYVSCELCTSHIQVLRFIACRLTSRGVKTKIGSE